jgi:hypothetical protein
MGTASASAPRGPSARATAPRVAAWIGIAVSLLLLPVTILGQATVTDQVDTTAEAVDARLEQAVPLVESASTAVDAVVTAARTVATTADSVASTGGSLQPALDEIESFSVVYEASRDSYQGALDAANAGIERLEAIATLLPLGVAQGLRDALSDLESRIQQLERASPSSSIRRPRASSRRSPARSPGGHDRSSRR